MTTQTTEQAELRKEIERLAEQYDLYSIQDNGRVDGDTLMNFALDVSAIEADRAKRAQGVSEILQYQGVFKGFDGLEGLANSQEFWDEQPYGTRLYFGDGGLDYLHRDVLRAAIRALLTSAQQVAPKEVQEATAHDIKDARLFRKLLSYMYWHRQDLVRHDDVRQAIAKAPNKYRCLDAAPSTAELPQPEQKGS